MGGPDPPHSSTAPPARRRAGVGRLFGIMALVVAASVALNIAASSRLRERVRAELRAFRGRGVGGVGGMGGWQRGDPMPPSAVLEQGNKNAAMSDLQMYYARDPEIAKIKKASDDHQGPPLPQLPSPPPHPRPLTCSPKWNAMLEEYARFHREGTERLVRGGLLDTDRIVVFTCRASNLTYQNQTGYCPGFADRLTGMASLFLFSLSEHKLFYVDFPEMHPYASSGVAGVDWRWNREIHELSAHANGRLVANVSLMNCERMWYSSMRRRRRINTTPCLFSKELDDTRLVVRELRGAHTAYVATNRGPTGSWLAGSDAVTPEVVTWGMTLTDDRAYNYRCKSCGRERFISCLYQALIKLDPVALGIPPEALRDANNMVALHIRRGDEWMLKNTDPGAEKAGFSDEVLLEFSRYFECANLVTDGLHELDVNLTNRTNSTYSVPQRPKMLFLSDSDELKRAASYFLKQADLVKTNTGSAEHISSFLGYQPEMPLQERIRDTLADWYLMSLARIVVHHYNTGYSHTATAHALGNRFISGWFAPFPNCTFSPIGLRGGV